MSTDKRTKAHGAEITLTGSEIFRHEKKYEAEPAVPTEVLAIFEIRFDGAKYDFSEWVKFDSDGEAATAKQDTHIETNQWTEFYYLLAALSAATGSHPDDLRPGIIEALDRLVKDNFDPRMAE